MDTSVHNALTGSRHLSLSFWWAWIWLMFFPGLPRYWDMEGHIGWWTVFMVGCSACSALFLLCRRPISGFLANKRLLLLAFVSLAVCTPCFYLLQPSLGLNAVVFLSGMLAAVWGAQSLARYVGHGGRELVCGCAKALFLAAVIYLATIDRDPIIELAVATALPLLSSASIYAAQNEGQDQAASVSVPDLDVLALLISNPGAALRLAIMFTCSLTYGLFGGLITMHGQTQNGYFIMGAIIAASVGLVVLCALRPSFIKPAAFYAIPIPCYLLGLMFLIVSLVGNMAYQTVSSFAVTVGWVSVLALGWGFSMGSSSIHKQKVLPVAHVLVLQLGTLCGSAVLLLTKALSFGNEQRLVLVMVLVLALVVLFAVAAFAQGSRGASEVAAKQPQTRTQEGPSQAQTPAEPAGQAAPCVQTVCQLLASDYGLSEREQEILDCLLKGYSLLRIAEQLGVAKSTVATHCQHIYKKLDVHTKQDLIRLAEQYND